MRSARDEGGPSCGHRVQALGDPRHADHHGQRHRDHDRRDRRRAIPVEGDHGVAPVPEPGLSLEAGGRGAREEQADTDGGHRGGVGRGGGVDMEGGVEKTLVSSLRSQENPCTFFLTWVNQRLPTKHKPIWADLPPTAQPRLGLDT